MNYWNSERSKRFWQLYLTTNRRYMAKVKWLLRHLVLYLVQQTKRLSMFYFE